MNRPVALGFRAVRGGGVAVAILCGEDEPRVVLSTFLATAAEGDRLAFEPYHVACELAGRSKKEAEAAIAEGRARQDRMAADGLRAIIERLQADGYQPVLAVLLINRAGWITDLLEHSLGAPEHPPVAEGLAVREALRFAFIRCGLAATELDEKSLPAIGDSINALGRSAGKPWRKEQKLACLAAWVASGAGNKS